MQRDVGFPPETHAPVNLQTVPGVTHSSILREQHGSRKVTLRFRQGGGIHHAPSRLGPNQHLCAQVFYGLEGAGRLPELLSLTRVPDRHFRRRDRAAQLLRRRQQSSGTARAYGSASPSKERAPGRTPAPTRCSGVTGPPPRAGPWTPWGSPRHRRPGHTAADRSGRRNPAARRSRPQGISGRRERLPDQGHLTAEGHLVMTGRQKESQGREHLRRGNRATAVRKPRGR